MNKLKIYLKTKPYLQKAVVCYFLNKRNITLGFRKQVSLGLGENLISGIGGKVGDLPGLEKESYEEALEREVMEEVQVKTIKYRRMGEIVFLFPAKPKWNQHVMAYIIDEWEGDFVETDAIKPVSFNANSLPYSQMWADNQHWLPLILQGKKINAQFLYNSDNATIEEFEINEV